jgi:hypothetical protein
MRTGARGKNPLPLLGIKPRSSSLQSDTILTDIPSSYMCVCVCVCVCVLSIYIYTLNILNTGAYYYIYCQSPALSFMYARFVRFHVVFHIVHYNGWLHSTI